MCSGSRHGHSGKQLRLHTAHLQAVGGTQVTPVSKHIKPSLQLTIQRPGAAARLVLSVSHKRNPNTHAPRCTHVRAHPHMCTLKHSHSHTPLHAHVHPCAHIYTLTHARAQSHSCTCTHKPLHTFVRSHSHVHACTPTHTHTQCTTALLLL